MNINRTDPANHNQEEQSAVVKKAIADLQRQKASGRSMNTPKEAIDLVVTLIRALIESTAAGIDAGIASSPPTLEDMQRVHELEALLQDLP